LSVAGGKCGRIAEVEEKRREEKRREEKRREEKRREEPT